MTYLGKFKNGVVVFEGEQPKLPEGAEVHVEPVVKAEKAPTAPARTLLEVMKPFIGIADGLPEDMSVNHDHYLYGTPKQKP